MATLGGDDPFIQSRQPPEFSTRPHVISWPPPHTTLTREDTGEPPKQAKAKEAKAVLTLVVQPSVFADFVCSSLWQDQECVSATGGDLESDVACACESTAKYMGTSSITTEKHIASRP